MENSKNKDDIFGKNQIAVPTEIINDYIKNKFFRNALYITEIGYSSNTKHHYLLNENNNGNYILIYCLDGKGRCQTQSNSFTIEANQFMLLSPGDLQHFQLAPEIPGSIYWVHFNGSMANDLKVDFDFQKYEKPTSLPFGDEVLEAWHKIYASLSDGFAFENMGYANFNLYHLISLFVFPNKANKSVQEDEDQLEKSIEFMKENLKNHLTVESIAKEFNYSSSHYSTLFKQKTGLSPIDYFIKLKIQYACQLLTKSNLIIKEVAQEVGYDDPFYFSRMFKKITGKSPIEYKGRFKVSLSTKKYTLKITA